MFPKGLWPTGLFPTGLWPPVVASASLPIAYARTITQTVPTRMSPATPSAAVIPHTGGCEFKEVAK